MCERRMAWILVAAAATIIAAPSLYASGLTNVSVTLSGPSECWVDSDETYTASGDYDLDQETEKQVQDGEASVSVEYSWSYSPAQLIAGGGSSDDYVTIRYDYEDGGAYHTVSVTYHVTVTYADGTSDSGQASDSIDVTVKRTQVSVGADKQTICAGAVDSAPHQTTITTTVTNGLGEGVSGKTVGFSVTNSDPDYPATVNPQQDTTDDSGHATTTLTSSEKIGATATVKATCEDAEYETSAITMAKAAGAWDIAPQTLIADGESTADVTLSLSFAGNAADGHSISWRIYKVWNGNDELVYTADPQWGSKTGYGFIEGGPDTTDANGQAPTVYTVGTKAGTIQFEGQDSTAEEQSPARYTSDAGADRARPTRVAVTRIKAFNDVPIVDARQDDLVFSQDFLDDGSLDVTVQDEPVCDYMDGEYKLEHEIGFYPHGRTADVEWRQTWSITKGDAVKAQHSKPPGGDWAQGTSGDHLVNCPSVVGLYDLLIEMNVRAPSASLWYTLPADQAKCTQYLTYRFPCCGEANLTDGHLDEVCAWAHNSTTHLECAEKVHDAISPGGAIGETCICNSGSFDDLWDAARDHNAGQCCCWAKGMIKMVEVLGMPYNMGYVNSAPEPGVRREAPTANCPICGPVYWVGWGGGIWNNYQGVCGKGTGHKWFSVQAGYEGSYEEVLDDAFPHSFEWADAYSINNGVRESDHLCTHLDPYE